MSLAELRRTLTNGNDLAALDAIVETIGAIKTWSTVKVIGSVDCCLAIYCAAAIHHPKLPWNALTNHPP